MSGSKAARSAVRALIGLVVLVAWTMTSGPAVAGPIAYNNPGVFGLDVWLVNPDGSNNQRVPVPADLLQAFGPVWSRDGRAIGAMGVITGAAANTPVVFDPGGTEVVVPVCFGICAIPTTVTGLVVMAFSPDGQTLAFSQSEAFFTSLGLVRLNTGQRVTGLLPGITFLQDPVTVPLGTTDPGGIGLDWSPIQNNLLVVSVPPTTIPPFGVLAQLALVQLDTGQVTQLTFPSSPDPSSFQVADIFPRFSPDGTRLAFVREFNGLAGLPSSSVLIVTDGATEQAVTEFSGLVAAPVSWSPDGTRLIFGLIDLSFGANFGVWTIDVAGTNLTQFLQPPAQNPSWSPTP